MKETFFVALGGALGSVGRYWLGSWVLRMTGERKFPLGTFWVNVLGCLAAGVLFGLNEKSGFLRPDMRMFIFVGILGGFTTFSAFGLETTLLLRRGDVAMALGYAAASLACGIAALWIGITACAS